MVNTMMTVSQAFDAALSERAIKGVLVKRGLNDNQISAVFRYVQQDLLRWRSKCEATTRMPTVLGSLAEVQIRESLLAIKKRVSANLEQGLPPHFNADA